MKKKNTRFVGLDLHKNTITIAGGPGKLLPGCRRQTATTSRRGHRLF